MEVKPSLIHRLFYPQVPAVLSASHKGRVSAMPVVSYAAVSASPPIIVVSCEPRGFTCKLATGSKKFSLCLLDAANVSEIAKLATTSGAEAKDKLESAGLKHSRGSSLDVPVIDGADATIECELQRKQKVGDHVLLFGLAKACYATKAFSDSWDFKKYRPILYTGWRGRMTTFPDSTRKT